MALTPGARLGPYEIVAPLGAGGMGEVYKARDTRLDRIVAVKVLPPAAAADPEFRERFEREAKSISALDHPNICTLYDVGEAPGSGPQAPATHYLVMQYLEGDTLAARLARSARPKSGASGVEARPPSGSSAATTIARGPIPLDQVLRFATETANALDAAHRRGIVHRDLKPGNVMLTKSGVKLLDFGLAKLTGQAPVSGFGDAQTKMASLTSQGALLGTLQYMSPEQLEGKDVDARGDIFAFGTMLFEMLTGRQPFESQSQAGMIAAILSEDPPPLADLADVRTTLPPAAHRALDRLLRKCLAKDPDDRWQCAADLGDELAWINDERLRGATDVEQASAGAVVPTAIPRSRTRERIWMAAAAVFALAAVGAGAWTWVQPKRVLEQVRFTIAAPEKAPYAGGPGLMALSPDGRRLAVVSTVDGKNQLWVRDLDSLTPRLLPGTEGAWHPVWSPTSRFVAFSDVPGGVAKLKKIDVSGGTPITIADALSYTVAWSSQGVILFTGTDQRLYRIPESGGQPVAVTALDKSRQETGHLWPTFLPDGRRFIYSAQCSDASKNALYLASLDSPSRTHLIDGLSSVGYAQGHLFFQRDSTLMAQPFDEKAGRLTGDAAPVIEGVQTNLGNGRIAFSVSADGTLAYRTGSNSASGSALTWFDAHGQRGGTVGEPSGGGFRISPDGRSLAMMSRRDIQASYDIWTIDLERNVSTRLTSDPKGGYNPVWSADGLRVIFDSNRKGHWDLYQRAAGGGGADELLFESPETKVPKDASRDGKLLLFDRDMRSQKKTDIWALPLTGERKPFPVVSTDFDEGDAVFSPDGRWIAYFSDESGTGQIYIQPFPPTGPRVRVSTTTGNHPAWSADGKQLFYRTRDNHVMTVDVTSPMRPGVPKELFTQGGAWTMDPVHQRFLMAVAPDATAAAPITVVLNWAAGLGKK